MTDSSDAPKVIFTDDGWILSATEPPLTVEKLKAEVVDSHKLAGRGAVVEYRRSRGVPLRDGDRRDHRRGHRGAG